MPGHLEKESHSSARRMFPGHELLPLPFDAVRLMRLILLYAGPL
jgi:hypothetical protein